MQIELWNADGGWRAISGIRPDADLRSAAWRRNRHIAFALGLRICFLLRLLRAFSFLIDYLYNFAIVRNRAILQDYCLVAVEVDVVRRTLVALLLNT